MKKSLLVVPPFPLDETVSSYLSRLGSYHVESIRRTSMRLLNRSKPLIDTLSCSVELFCRAMGQGWSASTVLSEHTLFDFYACGVPKERVSGLRDRLLNTSSGPARPTRLPLFLACPSGEFLHCPECDRLNQEKFGFQFFCRQHSVPYLQLCPWHGISLRPCEGGEKLYDSHCRGSEHISNEVRASQFARRALKMVITPWQVSEYQRDAIVGQMASGHWISADGRCARSEFLKTFHGLFDDAFTDARIRALCADSRFADSALRSLLRHDRNLHPIWCLLFKWTCDESPNAERRPGAIEHRTAGGPGEFEQIAVLQSSKSIRQAAKVVGVGQQTLIDLARRNGIAFSWRPKLVFADQRNRIVCHFKSGMTPAQIASLCGVSLSTVYRVLAADPGVERGWREEQINRRLPIAREA